MDNESQSLPATWVKITLGEIRIDKSKTINPMNNNIKYELYSVTNFDKKIPELLNGNQIGSNKITVEKDTVLLSKINPRINRVWIVDNFSDYKKIASTEWIPFFYNECVNPKYLMYYLQSESFRQYLAMNVSGVGGSLMRINRNIVDRYDFPLAPLAEQGRIVNKLDEIFTRLDSGIAQLKKTQIHLKRYRRSILKSAFEGKIIEQKQNPHFESKNTFNASTLSDLNLPNIPDKWLWVNLGSFIESMKNGIYKPAEYYSDNGTPCLRMYNIDKWKIEWKDIKRMDLTNDEILDYQLKPNDILVNRVNSRELVGKSAVIPVDMEKSVFESKNIRLRLKHELINCYFVNYWFELFAQKYFNSNAQQTVGMASINQEQLANMPIPYPHIMEQKLIVEKIEEINSIINNINIILEKHIIKMYNCKKTILKNAFLGKLITQNQSDEPVSILLENIRNENKEITLSKKRRRNFK